MFGYKVRQYSHETLTTETAETSDAHETLTETAKTYDAHETLTETAKTYDSHETLLTTEEKHIDTFACSLD